MSQLDAEAASELGMLDLSSSQDAITALAQRRGRGRRPVEREEINIDATLEFCENYLPVAFVEDGDDEGDNNELAQRKGDVLQSIGRQIANLCTGFINANTDDDPEITGEGDSAGSGGDIPIILDGDVEP